MPDHDPLTEEQREALSRLDPFAVQLHEALDASRAQTAEVDARLSAERGKLREAEATIRRHEARIDRLIARRGEDRGRLDSAQSLLLEASALIALLLDDPDTHLQRAHELISDAKAWRAERLGLEEVQHVGSLAGLGEVVRG